MKRSITLMLLFFCFLMQGQSFVLDPSFGTNGMLSTSYGIGPKNGYFENHKYYLFGTDRRFARFNEDGSLDSSFGNSGFLIFSISGENTTIKNFKMHDGKCYGFGLRATATALDGLIIRLAENGQLDPTFGNGGIVNFDLGAREFFNDILINADGTFYALGVKQDTQYDGKVLLCKFLANGTLDTSFNTTGSKVFPFSQTAKGIALFSYQDNILLGNWTNGGNGNSDIYLQKIDSNGNLMTDFGTNGELRIPIPIFGSASSDNFYDLKLVGNNIYAKFYYGTSFNSQGHSLYAFDITNSVTPILTLGVRSDSYFKVLDSGKVIIADGTSCPHPSCYSTKFKLSQFNSNGSLDTTFGNNGNYEFDFSSYYNTVEGATFFYQHDDGRFFIAGIMSNLCMLRIAPSTLSNGDLTMQDELSVYPNPSSEVLYIRNKTNKLLEEITISDISGKKIKKVLNTNNSIDISELSKGIYFLSFSTDGNYHTLKFVKS